MILTHIRAAGARLHEIKRFDMPGFQPRAEYVREMRRYGILPAGDQDDQPLLGGDRREAVPSVAQGFANARRAAR